MLFDLLVNFQPVAYVLSAFTSSIAFAVGALVLAGLFAVGGFLSATKSAAVWVYITTLGAVGSWSAITCCL